MVFLALVLTGQANANVTGRARVIDGDTLEITAQRIRLALRRGKWNWGGLRRTSSPGDPK